MDSASQSRRLPPGCGGAPQPVQSGGEGEDAEEGGGDFLVSGGDNPPLVPPRPRALDAFAVVVDRLRTGDQGLVAAGRNGCCSRDRPPPTSACRAGGPTAGRPAAVRAPGRVPVRRQPPVPCCRYSRRHLPYRRASGRAPHQPSALSEPSTAHCSSISTSATLPKGGKTPAGTPRLGGRAPTGSRGGTGRFAFSP